MNMVGLPPGMIITSSGETSTRKALVQVGGDRLAQRQDAGRRRVAVMAVAQRLDRGLDDVVRRAEVGLADAEIDDVAALPRRAAVARASTAKAFSSPMRSNCFEPANLPLHAFQVMLPFGPVDPIDSLRVAQDVYAKVPFLSKVFEDRFNQRLLARITDSSYNLGTNFAWKNLSDLKGRRIAGAGLNLNWLKYAGVTPVQSSLPEAYTSMQTRVYDGWIMFPSAWVNLKLHEVGPFYTLIGFGTITWHGLTINSDTWKKLPKEVQDIMVATAKDFEEQVGKVNRARYEKDIGTLKGLIAVNSIDDSVRKEWAEALKDWPQAIAKELDGKGLPASEVLKLTLEAAEKHGHKWPYKYQVK
jgi:hypothetical protein